MPRRQDNRRIAQAEAEIPKVKKEIDDLVEIERSGVVEVTIRATANRA